MARFQPGRCCYCNRPFTKPQNGRKQPGRLNPTIEHLYPQNAVLPPRLKDWGEPLNKMRACFACNNRKGDKHPLQWLTMMESDDCAAEISKFMLAMGEDAYRVGYAMGKRSCIIS
jgi:hypothetical protein